MIPSTTLPRKNMIPSTTLYSELFLTKRKEQAILPSIGLLRRIVRGSSMCKLQESIDRSVFPQTVL